MFEEEICWHGGPWLKDKIIQWELVQVHMRWLRLLRPIRSGVIGDYGSSTLECDRGSYIIQMIIQMA